METPKKNQQLIFPEDSSEIIRRILEKHGLGETLDEILKKGGKSNAEKLAAIAAAAAKIKVSLDILSLVIERELKVSKEVAQEIAKELKEKLLSLVEEYEKEKIPSLSERTPTSKTEILPEKKEKFETSRQTDIYREPLE